jgi:sigma-B regulation protein RsbU (phosphoserine phosphatase)
MPTDTQALELIRNQVGEIIFGTFFVLIGLIAGAIAVIRSGKGVKVIFWLAMWSGMYGIQLLIVSPAVSMFFPQLFQGFIPYIQVSITYLILVFALLAWLDLTRGKLHLFIKIMIFAGLAIALAGIGCFIITGVADTFILYNSLLAAGTLIILVIIVSIRKLSDKYLVLPNRGVLAVGTFIFTAEALYSNLSTLFGYQSKPILGWLGFAVLLFSFAYVAAKMIFANEHRLLSIEAELETARQIQSSILPATVPELDGLRVASAYYPMTAVAGDFYDFIQIDSHHAGFLVADVSGHGVPAALIASMIKVAMQSVLALADDPGKVLKRLGEILGNQLRGQFLTAAYLFIDSENHQARYSAAGHPPLLYWDSTAQQMQFIESNGLFFGASKESDYPVRKIKYNSGDRFLLYTDGLTEAMNSASELFGDQQLSKVLKSNENAAAGELSTLLYTELQLWQNTSVSQQDDITWIIIEIL